MKNHEFEELLGTIYGAILDGGGLRATVLELERAYDTLYTSLIVNIKDTGFGPLDGDMFLGARACLRGGEADLTTDSLWTWPRGVPRALRDEDVEALYEDPECGPIAQFLMPSHRGRTAALSFYRAHGARPFSAKELEELTLLCKHMDRSIELSDRFREVSRVPTLNVLNLVNFAVLALDDRARPILLNELARQLIAEDDGICIRQGQVHFASAGVEFVEAFQYLTSRVVPPSFEVFRPKRGGTLSVTLVPTNGETNGLLAGASAMLVVADPARQALGLVLAMREKFALTEGEGRFAAAFAASRSLQAAASELGIAEETGRRHIKNIFNKTGTHSQAELIYLLTAHPLALFGSNMIDAPL